MPIPEFYRGDTKRYKVTVTDPVTSNPVNITGWKVYFTLKSDKDFTDAEAEAQVIAIAGADAADDVVNGVMYVELDSVTSKIEPANYYYDFQAVAPGTPPKVKTVDDDRVRVLDGTTDDDS